MSRPIEPFANREAAGRALATRLLATPRRDCVVYALPRGGVPVALPVAQALGAPLDLILVRKIGAPGQEELALGAVVDGDDPVLVVNETVRRARAVSDADLEAAEAEQLREVERRRALYLKGRAPIDPRGRTAVVVDDGLATGATAKAALVSLRRRGAKTIVLAVPVAPRESLIEMEAYADEIVCLLSPRAFSGVGQFYRDFHQLTDAETTRALDAAARSATSNR